MNVIIFFFWTGAFGVSVEPHPSQKHKKENQLLLLVRCFCEERHSLWRVFQLRELLQHLGMICWRPFRLMMADALWKWISGTRSRCNNHMRVQKPPAPCFSIGNRTWKWDTGEFLFLFPKDGGCDIVNVEDAFIELGKWGSYIKRFQSVTRQSNPLPSSVDSWDYQGNLKIFVPLKRFSEYLT